MTDTKTNEHSGEDVHERPYVLDYEGEYFFSRHDRVEFVVFGYRIASLAWLRSRMTETVDGDLARMRETRRMGAVNPLES
ncbi:hypothetical protein [Actinacidiphila sp. bgisy160]|uniref:hypothetical protein n=1 Tax=Actinacidiphila sp. bgisy160 TaxID=3413796 RepID=UPI003D765066